MRVRLLGLVCTAFAALAWGATIAQARHAAGHHPTKAQVRQALARARHSQQLWATINVCRAKGHQGSKGGEIGVRGQMPTLGFAATLSMTVQLNHWSTKTKTFSPLPFRTAKTTVSPGTFAKNLHQDGAVFPFGGPTGLLDATVTFSWSRGGKLLGTAVRRTAAGHHDAAGSRPPRYSAAQCRLG
jgi:hypothetical protein